MNNWYTDFNKYYNHINTTIINKHHFESYNDFIGKILDGSIINKNEYFKLYKRINGVDLQVNIAYDGRKSINSPVIHIGSMTLRYLF